MFGHALFGREDQVIQFIAGGDHLFLPFVFFGVSFGIFYHALDFLLIQRAGAFDTNGLFFAGAFVFGRHVQDAVSIDVEGYFDLRNTTGSRWDVGEVKATEGTVVFGHGAFTLQYMDGNRRLVISSGREYLAFLGWDGCIPLDKGRHHRTQSFYTQ